MGMENMEEWAKRDHLLEDYNVMTMRIICRATQVENCSEKKRQLEKILAEKKFKSGIHT